MTINWPKQWDPNAGWPNAADKTTPVSSSDPRTWADTNERLKQQGTSFDAVIEAMKNGTPLPEKTKKTAT